MSSSSLSAFELEFENEENRSTVNLAFRTTFLFFFSLFILIAFGIFSRLFNSFYKHLILLAYFLFSSLFSISISGMVAMSVYFQVEDINELEQNELILAILYLILPSLYLLLLIIMFITFVSKDINTITSKILKSFI